MLRGLLAAALTVVATSLTGAAAGAPAATLSGSVGPGFTISLKNADGTAVSHLDPGSYAITVDDQGSIHNFHLSGPGVDMATDITGTGTTAWTVNLVNGTYTFRCDAHPTTMKGSFTVGTVTPPPPPPVRLVGQVGPRKTISLKRASGVRVVVLSSTPTYRIDVRDRTKTENFHLIGPGVNRKTRVATKGSLTWTLRFAPGRYTYRSDKTRRLRGSFSVRLPAP